MIELDKNKNVDICKLNEELKVVFPNGRISFNDQTNKFYAEIENTPENVIAVQTVITNHNYEAIYNDLQRNSIKKICKKIMDSTDWIMTRQETHNNLLARGIISNAALSEAEFNDFCLFRYLISQFDINVNLENIIWPTPPIFLNSKLNVFEPYSNLT